MYQMWHNITVSTVLSKLNSHKADIAVNVSDFNETQLCKHSGEMKGRDLQQDCVAASTAKHQNTPSENTDKIYTAKTQKGQGRPNTT